ncbi:hypothetical protein M0802_013406 [Mischocyttarus mexicanus]|nr:hypothetical protein M0802_013406 [Mischocyttarus mexicanus]
MQRYGYNKGEVLGKNSDGILKPISLIPRRVHQGKKLTKNIVTPVRPYETRSRSKQTLPSSSFSLPPSFFPPPSLSLSPAPTLSPPGSLPSHSSSPSPSESNDSDEPNPCAIPRPIDQSPLFKLVNSRDCLKNRKDNLVIFISYQGKPLDKGALELHENQMLPVYKDIMAEKAKVTNITRTKN